MPYYYVDLNEKFEKINKKDMKSPLDLVIEILGKTYKRKHIYYYGNKSNQKQLYGYEINSSGNITIWNNDNKCTIDSSVGFEHILSFFEITDFFRPTDDMIDIINKAIPLARSLDALSGKSLLDIGQLAELIIGKKFDLLISKSKISEGFDAINKEGKLVQIKARKLTEHSFKHPMLGVFSEHPFDYAIMAIFDEEYNLTEVWKAPYNSIETLLTFKKMLWQISLSNDKKNNKFKRQLRVDEFKRLLESINDLHTQLDVSFQSNKNLSPLQEELRTKFLSFDISSLQNSTEENPIQIQFIKKKGTTS